MHTPTDTPYALCEDGEIRRVTILMTEAEADKHQRMAEERYASLDAGKRLLEVLRAHPEGLTEEQLAAVTQLDRDTVRREITSFTDGKLVLINDGLLTVKPDYRVDPYIAHLIAVATGKDTP